MKKLFIISITLLIGLAAHAQGSIGYANDSTARVTEYDYPIATGPVVVTSASGVDIQLYYQADNGGAAPAAINGIGTGNWIAAPVTGIITPGGGGLFAGPNLTLTGVAGGANAWIDIIGWNNVGSGVTTFAAALANSVPNQIIASSAVFATSTGNPNGTPPAVPVSIAGAFAAAGGLELALIPEPTPIALSGLGAAALLLFRRGK